MYLTWYGIIPTRSHNMTGSWIQQPLPTSAWLIHDAFINYIPLKYSTIKGLGDPVMAHRQGTILVDFVINGKMICHQLWEVLHICAWCPKLSFIHPSYWWGTGTCGNARWRIYIKGQKGNYHWEGSLSRRLYILEAKTQFPSQEKANYAASNKLTCDQWHRLYRHITISSLEQLDRDKMVDGMAIDHTSLSSWSCEACIKAKHAHAPFPKEAENCSETAGEHVISDVWERQTPNPVKDIFITSPSQMMPKDSVTSNLWWTKRMQYPRSKIMPWWLNGNLGSSQNGCDLIMKLSL